MCKYMHLYLFVCMYMNFVCMYMHLYSFVQHFYAFVLHSCTFSVLVYVFICISICIPRFFPISSCICPIYFPTASSVSTFPPASLQYFQQPPPLHALPCARFSTSVPPCLWGLQGQLVRFSALWTKDTTRNCSTFFSWKGLRTEISARYLHHPAQNCVPRLFYVHE